MSIARKVMMAAAAAGGGGLTPVAADTLYISDNAGDRFSTFDFSTPSSPVLLNSYRNLSFMDGPSAVAVDPATKVAYVAASVTDGVVAFDVSNPASISYLGRFVSSSLNSATVLCLDTDLKVCYALGSNRRLMAIDVSNPAGMTEISYVQDDAVFPLPSELRLDQRNKIVYFMSGSYDMFAAVDVSNPASMSVLGSYTNVILDNANQFALDLDTQVAYMASGSSAAGRLVAINIADPTNLSLLSTLGLPTPALRQGTAIDLVNKIVYTADTTVDSVSAVDVSDPSNMVFLSSYGSTNLDVVTRLELDSVSQILYAACPSNDRVTLLDVSNPSNMTEIGIIRQLGYMDNGSFAINTNDHAMSKSYV